MRRHSAGRLDRSHGRDGRRRAREWAALRQAALLDSLRRTVEKLNWRPAGTAWAGLCRDDELLRRRGPPARTRSFGASSTAAADASSGTSARTSARFSAIAASLGRSVVAWDGDPGATDSTTEPSAERKRRGDPAPVGPRRTRARASVGRTPSAGRSSTDRTPTWSWRWRLSTTWRSAATSGWRWSPTCSRASARSSIVEFIPDTDPMAQRLLQARGRRPPEPHHRWLPRDLRGPFRDPRRPPDRGFLPASPSDGADDTP